MTETNNKVTVALENETIEYFNDMLLSTIARTIFKINFLKTQDNSDKMILLMEEKVAELEKLVIPHEKEDGLPF